MSIDVKELVDKVKSKDPNVFIPTPIDGEFLKQHYSIIEPYLDYIKLYKMNCFQDINNYYRTGIIPEYPLEDAEDEQVRKFVRKCEGPFFNKIKKTMKQPTYSKIIKLVIAKLEELFNKVKPLDYDLIVYRGVKQGVIGQNIANGRCAKTRLYSLAEHFVCAPEEIEDIRLFKNFKDDDENALEYLYDSMGFTSCSREIGVAYSFSRKFTTEGPTTDTILMLKVPAGTKFILPINKLLENYYTDVESELILFPQQNIFVVYDTASILIEQPKNIDELFTQVSKSTVPLYIGSFSPEFNKYYKNKFVKKLRIKAAIDSSEWESLPSMLKAGGPKCKGDCDFGFNLCDNDTGDCLADNEESRQKIKNWWRKNSIMGKCDEPAVNKCVDEYKFCNPQDASCVDSMPSEIMDKFYPRKK